MTIKYPIIVEGKYDKIKLDSIVSAKVITTEGFGIFNDKEKLNTLNNTVLGHVIGKIREMVSDYEKNGFDIVAVDAPTLIESGFNTECNCVISVLAPTEERLKRIEKRDSLTKEQALQRLNAQKSDDFYVDHSDFVIINDKGFEKTKKELLKILNGIRS